ncbi:MAG: 3-phosphoshikimate 1-carboxyvinyltransferase [Candidatus Omnitrophica bacterium]|nr:3-phosphoshikimate 1-carboxyvinyltransferase [Candidatus Omnitrophota bacterium]
MFLHVKPTQRLSGSIHLPASKSYSIRAFMIAACGGESEIISPSNCEDAHVAMRVARALGCSITRKKDRWTVKATRGTAPIKMISVGESGTVLRLLLPLLSTLTDRAVIVGERTLIGRPNTHLLEALRRQGLNISGAGEKESVPIRFQGGTIKSGKITIDGSLSSQFVSALLMTAPSLSKDSLIQITGKKIVSKDYITMTLQMLERAGVAVSPKGERSFAVKGSQTFQGFKNFTVPSDYGLAAFLMAAASIVPSAVELRGCFDDGLIQADGHILKFLKTMGAKWTRAENAIVMKGPFKLKGGTFSLQDCPDLVPIMAVIALFAKSPTVLKNIHHARAKESDRISDLRTELLKVGARVEETKDTLLIHPLTEPRAGAVLDPHHDHRLAMAFAVLGLRVGLTVKDVECSHKSYPNFVRDFKAVGALVSTGQKR